MAWWVDLIYAAALVYFRCFPVAGCRRLLEATEALDAGGIRPRVAGIRRSPRQLQWMQGLLESGYPLSLRKQGINNDLAQFAAIEDYPLAQVQCPTLVVHGRFDGNVPFEHAEFVARGVPGAELLIAEGCGHLLWMSDVEPRIRRVVQDFLNKHAHSASVL